jgi:hypothetical protein
MRASAATKATRPNEENKGRKIDSNSDGPLFSDVDLFLEGDDSSKTLEASSPLSAVLLASSLLGICLMAFAIRLFAVFRWESVIHEFVSDWLPLLSKGYFGR